MLKEVAEFLVDTGRDQLTVDVREFPNNPDKRLLVKPDGTTEPLDTPRQPTTRKHSVATVADFASACQHLIVPPDIAPSPVWFDARRVIIFPDDRYRDDCIWMDIPASAQLNTLTKWEYATRLTQKQIVRILRHDLAGCLEDPGTLQSFRTINWDSMANTKRILNHDKQSMDRDVSATVTGGAEKVQLFVVTFPLFDHPDFREVKFTTKVTVDFECETQEITVQLLPGELKRALEVSLEAVRTNLSTGLEGATLIAGRP